MQGKYSENDTANWTPELRKTLNYDQTQARQVDNGERDLTFESEVKREFTFDLCTPGVFWIDWKSLQTFYDVVYINWNPNLFKHKSTLHE